MLTTRIPAKENQLEIKVGAESKVTKSKLMIAPCNNRTPTQLPNDVGKTSQHSKPTTRHRPERRDLLNSMRETRKCPKLIAGDLSIMSIVFTCCNQSAGETNSRRCTVPMLVDLQELHEFCGKSVEGTGRYRGLQCGMISIFRGHYSEVKKKVPENNVVGRDYSL